MQRAKVMPRSALTELLPAVLNKGIPFRFRAGGFSMSPFIKDGDMITVCPVSEDHIRTGDVVAVVYEERERLVIHRVIGKNGKTWMIKGDNNFNADGFVQEERILGRVEKVERNGRRIYFGLGKERLFIVWITRMNLYLQLIRTYRSIMRKFVEKEIL